MPKSRNEIRHEGQHRAPWVSPHYGDGGWHGTPGCLTFDPRTIVPFGDHILVELDPEPEQSSVIAVPDVARGNEIGSRKGTVLKVGKGLLKEKRKNTESWMLNPLQRERMTLKPGDRVLIGHYSDWESWHQDWERNGRNIVLCQQNDVRVISEG